ncbi:hypothetical protein DFH07DRAFT_753891 [Mycena maculata]|uniref:Uncharacterized protein n=1 Tax=Mycena maculata TaxID=230809 RepID=A0AAD7I5H7_9AGAR|nr:hypothetical protein DFH07DRAFT_753891 [Mycena maculata]
MVPPSILRFRPSSLTSGIGDTESTAALYSQMAEFDLATNQTNYQAALENYFPLAETGHANFSQDFVSDSVNFTIFRSTEAYGRAAIRAYTAYNNQSFLNYAIQSWWWGRGYTISSADASAGKIDCKDFNISSVCLDSDLSALLAEATSDDMYLEAAVETAEFVHAHLYNVENVVQDSISARSSDSCAVSSNVEPYNSGLMIEGLAILADITGNASTQSLLSEILLAAIPNTAWQQPEGIVESRLFVLRCRSPLIRISQI